MPDGGSLIIRTDVVDGKTVRDRHREADAGTYVSIEVSDAGKGIDENIRDRIFEPFLQRKSKVRARDWALPSFTVSSRTTKGSSMLVLNPAGERPFVSIYQSILVL
jgi:hypothetical protein